MFATYQKLSDSFALCANNADQNVNNIEDLEEKIRRERKTREMAARSKSGTWGPTHSFDSDEELRDEKKSTASRSNWHWGVTPSVASKAACDTLSASNDPSALKRSPGTNSTKSSDSSPKVAAPATMINLQGKSWGAWPNCGQDTTTEGIPPEEEGQGIMGFMDEVCDPCSPRNLDATAFGIETGAGDSQAPTGLGICRMQPPNCNSNSSYTCPPSHYNRFKGNSNSVGDDAASNVTPAERRRQRHKRRQSRASSSSQAPSPHEDYEVTTSQIMTIPPEEPKRRKNRQHENSTNSSSSKGKSAPLDSFTLDKTSTCELERSISELTMRSSYGVATAKLSDNRRMAYYAVGKHHRQSGRGGNRRCYFTGKLILGGAPFYAGSVQQGLRTLVVFCLPSSLGLPKGTENKPSVLAGLEGGSVARGSSSMGKGFRSSGILSRKGSRMSNPRNALDEMSLSVGEELDPNWGLDKDYLLSVLPDPEQALLNEMSRRFPQQFDTLPVQVRSPDCWRLYVKFCFFSGLPIAEGELHYKVRDEVADIFGEEVILSHEVMEAVNGKDSAEILRLPNLKTFSYLRRHYTQQSAKLPDQVFERQAWEMIRPEV